MRLDSEIDALLKAYEVLSPLNDDSKIRVIQWLASKFQLGQNSLVIGGEKAAASAPSNAHAEESTGTGTSAPMPKPAADKLEAFSSVEDLIRAIRPNSDADKALVAAAFLRVKKNQKELTSAEVQRELKRIGQRVSNITQAISALEKRKPKLMMQTSKEGSSQQARKRYEVTAEGIKVINDMLKR